MDCYDDFRYDRRLTRRIAVLQASVLHVQYRHPVVCDPQPVDVSQCRSSVWSVQQGPDLSTQLQTIHHIPHSANKQTIVISHS